MENLRSLKKLIESVVHPLVVLNRDQIVIAVNSEAANLFDVNNDTIGKITFGQLLDCDNAHKLSKCGSSLNCSCCRIAEVLDKVVETRGLIKNHSGVIMRNPDGLLQCWRIIYSARFIEFESGLIILTIHTVYKDKEELIKKNKTPGPDRPGPESMVTTKVVQDNGDFKPGIVNNNYLKLESFVKLLIDKDNDGIILVDENCKVLRWNNAITDEIGFPMEKLVEGIKISDLLALSHLKIQSGENKNWEGFVSNCNKLKYIEGSIESGEGSKLDLRIEFSPIFNQGPEFQGAIVIFKIKPEYPIAIEGFEIGYPALENAPIEVLLLEPSGVIKYANKNACNALGLKPDSYNNLNIRDINPNIENDWWTDYYRNLINKGIFRFESKHINTEGSTYPVVVNMSVLKDEQLVCYFSYDNSEQNRIQETLYKESRINESLAEISHELSLHNTLGSVALLVRQYALEISESMYCFIVYEDPSNNQLVSSIYSDSSENYQQQVFEVESLIKKHNYNLNPNKEDFRSGFSDTINNTSLFGIDGILLNKLLPFDNAAWTGIFFHEEYIGLLYVAGKEGDYSNSDLIHLKSLANLFGVAVNRIQEQVKLVSNMEQLELALDVSNMAVWNIFPEDDKIIIDNRSDKLLFNLGLPNEISFRHSDNLVHPEDLEKVVLAFNEHLNSNSSFFKSAIRLKNKKKDYNWYEVSGRVVGRSKTGEIKRITGVAIDINNMMRLNEDLVKSKEEAVLANKAKSGFIARISHEIRTPLNAIIGFSEYLISRINDPVQLDYLKNIKTNGVKLVGLLTDVLDYSKIESGNMELKLKPVNIVDLAEEVYKLLSLSAEQKRIEFRVEISGNLPDALLLDEIQLRQILVNLIGNAIKFTEKGYIKLIIKAKNITDNDLDLIISVADTGIGIKPGFQVKIFEDFTQQEDQDNRRYGGTGLGLGIVKKLVELMNGDLKLKSIPGKGSYFRVVLPKRIIFSKSGLNKPIESGKKKNGIPFVKVKNNIIPISIECKNACLNTLKSDWARFKLRPSFKEAPLIGEKIKNIGNQFNDKVLIEINNRINKCLTTFDVEELNQIISDFENYLGVEVN